MNHAEAELGKLQEPEHTVRSQPTPMAARPDDVMVMRDFFRRGDRGQYEGGKADVALNSSPTWDTSERQPIVRTPQQRARRALLMRAEALMMAACLSLLVAAARAKFLDRSVKQFAEPIHSSEPLAQTLAARLVQNRPAERQPAGAPAPTQLAAAPVPTANGAAIIPPPPKASAAAPDVRLAPTPEPPHVSPSVVSKVPAPAAEARVPRATPKAAATSGPAQTKSAPPYTPASVSTASVVTSRRAVAAFPDD